MNETTTDIHTFFPYSWHTQELDINNYDVDDVTNIRMYGLNKDNKNICVRVDDFKPYLYVELPLIGGVSWTYNLVIALYDKMFPDYRNSNITKSEADYLTQRDDKSRPLKISFVRRYKLYYANMDRMTMKRKKFPFIYMEFENIQSRKQCLWNKLTKKYRLDNMTIRLKAHEQNASDILQFISRKKLPTAGWINFRGEKVSKKNQITLCDEEYIVKWKQFRINTDLNYIPEPLVMSYDIETYSVNPDIMSDPRIDKNCVFQISCILSRKGVSEHKYLHTLGDPDDTVGKDVSILRYKTECDLLCGFVDFINKHNPNVIIGYNILTFDIPYLIKRSEVKFVSREFSIQGFLKDVPSIEKKIKWSSKAYGNQEFKFLDTEGRLFIDLFPIIKRDYKLSNYKLKTVATEFIGETKDPLNHKGIFKCYDAGIKNVNGVYSKKSRKAMGIVGKYCIKDAELVIRIYKFLDTWSGLCEMATTCNVPIFYLYTKGQQIKVFSQLYKFCMHNNIVVECDGYKAKEGERYVGATVFEPVPGVYDRVLPFDFASLYPTTIIAYNIDYSTLVKDPLIPDSKCHVMEWEDHHGCRHDKTVRSSKPKHIMCCKRKFRFLKEPKGVMPTILENLLDARKHTRRQIKILKKAVENEKLLEQEKEIIKDYKISSLAKNSIKKLISVLNKRQLAYKVSANSMYGAMGVVDGYIPFMPGAMATTAMGRKNINIVADIIPKKFGGQLVYGDTDSNYIIFPKLKTASENWDYALKVADEVTKLFPPPIKLEFEEEIYWRFFILTKKRYMYKKCGRDGVIEDKVGKKGVLLARRDKSVFIRYVYEKLITKVFNRDDGNDIINFVNDTILDLFRRKYKYNDFVLTKSIKGIGMLSTNFNIGLQCSVNCTKSCCTNNDNHIVSSKEVDELCQYTGKGLIGDYKVPLLHKDVNLRKKQFILKKCTNARDYYLRCLPPIVQLAQKMRRRGQRVDDGSRIEYVITSEGGIKAKQYEKIEHYDYLITHSKVIDIDYMYYLDTMIKPFDDVLNIMNNNNTSREYIKGFKGNFVKAQYKYIKNRIKVINEIKQLNKPKILLI